MYGQSEARLRELLVWLSDHLDPVTQREIERRHQQALSWAAVERLPLVLSYPLDEGSRFRPWPHREVFEDPAKMLFNELTHAFECSIVGNVDVRCDLPCTVRANFGTVLIASLFGAKVEQIDDNPPWIGAEGRGQIRLQTIADHDPCDLSGGWIPRAIERYKFYTAMFSEHPTLKQTVRLVLPDLQGPFDTLELLIGSGLFTDLCDHPEEVQRALRTLAQVQVNLARRFSEITTDGPSGSAHQHATTIRGHILIRDDTAILVSPRTYREQMAPHDGFVLQSLGGGGIHCCGVVQRHAPAFLEVESCECFDFGQSELNDVDAIYSLARERRIGLVRVWASREELLDGSIRRRFPTGVSLRHRANSAADARRIMEAYLRCHGR